MKSYAPKIGRSAKTGQFVLNSGRAAKISAVEGMKVTPRIAKTLAHGSKNGLSGDETRTLIRDQFRKK